MLLLLHFLFLLVSFVFTPTSFLLHLLFHLPAHRLFLFSHFSSSLLYSFSISSSFSPPYIFLSLLFPSFCSYTISSSSNSLLHSSSILPSLLLLLHFLRSLLPSFLSSYSFFFFYYSSISPLLLLNFLFLLSYSLSSYSSSTPFFLFFFFHYLYSSFFFLFLFNILQSRIMCSGSGRGVIQTQLPTR